MKVFLLSLVLGLNLGHAWAQDSAQSAEVVTENETSKEKYSDIVKSTLELMGPEEDNTEMTKVDESISVSQSSN